MHRKANLNKKFQDENTQHIELVPQFLSVRKNSLKISPVCKKLQDSNSSVQIRVYENFINLFNITNLYVACCLRRNDIKFHRK